MKKALIVLLILAVAGGLFAQSFTGSVTSGALIDFGKDAKDETPITVTANDDDAPSAVKANLNFSNEGDEWGVALSADAKVSTGNAVSGWTIGDMNGWVKFADIFKLTAGKGVGGDWQAASDLVDEGIGGSNAGARLQAEPIPGLNVGVVFGYPDYGVKAGKIGNFFQETGIGAKYDAGIFVVGTQIELFSEESTFKNSTAKNNDKEGVPELDKDGELALDDDGKPTYTHNRTGLDANWWLDAKIPLAGLFDIQLEVAIKNLFGKEDTLKMDKLVGVRLNGDVVGLSWNLGAKFKLNDETTATASAGLEYPIAITDKATATLGADAGLTLMKDFSFDTWDVWGKLGYDFNEHVSTFFKLKVAGANVAKKDSTEKEMKLTPTLQWNIGYSF